MYNSENKRALAISHNAAYLESKKHKPKKALSVGAMNKASTWVAAAAVLEELARAKQL